MKKCKCEEYETCNAETSCMYDFIALEHVDELETLVIEDLSCGEKVVICDEHIPQLIAELQNYKQRGDTMEQYLVTYNNELEVVRCLFLKEHDAINYAEYITDIFNGEQKPTITKVRVLPAY